MRMCPPKVLMLLLAVLYVLPCGCAVLSPVAGPAIYAGIRLIRAFRDNDPPPAREPAEQEEIAK